MSVLTRQRVGDLLKEAGDCKALEERYGPDHGCQRRSLQDGVLDWLELQELCEAWLALNPTAAATSGEVEDGD